MEHFPLPPQKPSVDIFNPNPSYIPAAHSRPNDGMINTASPVLEPLKGLRAEDFDRLISAEPKSPELQGYDPAKFLRIRSFFLRVALKSPEEMAEKRKDAEMLTAQIWNEAAAASVSGSPFSKKGAVQSTEWYRINGEPNLKLMNRFSRARMIASGISGHGGIARLQKQAKFIANAEQQPVARAVERARKNNDTSHNARKNEAFLKKTTEHVHHANHVVVARVKGTEDANILRHPIGKVAAKIRNRGKIGNYLEKEGTNTLRAKKIEGIIEAQNLRAAEKAEARTAKQERRAERKEARREKQRSKNQNTEPEMVQNGTPKIVVQAPVEAPRVPEAVDSSNTRAPEQTNNNVLPNPKDSDLDELFRIIDEF